MDGVLGDYNMSIDTCSEDGISETLADGTKRCQCPILSCKTKTFRLPRHVENLHSNLSYVQKENAIKFAKIIACNVHATGGKKSEVLGIGKTKRINPVTGMVRRKNNFKKCAICRNLVINLSQHLTSVHKLESTNSIKITNIGGFRDCF